MPNTGGGSLWTRTRTSGRTPPHRTISARLPYSTLPTLRSTPACHPEPKAKDLERRTPMPVILRRSRRISSTSPVGLGAFPQPGAYPYTFAARPCRYPRT